MEGDIVEEDILRMMGYGEFVTLHLGSISRLL